MDDMVWMPTIFTKNLERLIAHDTVIELFNEVLGLNVQQRQARTLTRQFRLWNAPRSNSRWKNRINRSIAAQH
jgi:hypothetical protein